MTEPNLEKMRQEFASLRNTAGDGESCPAADLLWASATEQIDRAENEAVIAHLATCGSCAASWRLAREMQQEETGAAPAGRRPLVSRGWVGLAAAAVLVLVAGFVVVRQLGLPDGQQPVFRSAPWGDLTSMTDPEAVLPRDAMTLEWTGGPEGTIYDLRLTTDRLESLHRAFDIETSSYRVPAEALSTLPPGSVVLWTVTAHLPDGRTWESPAFRATLE